MHHCSRTFIRSISYGAFVVRLLWIIFLIPLQTIEMVSSFTDFYVDKSFFTGGRFWYDVLGIALAEDTDIEKFGAGQQRPLLPLRVLELAEKYFVVLFAL